MSYAVQGGELWTYDDDPQTGATSLGPVDEAVADALDVLRAAWGPDAVTTEYASYTENAPKRTVARSRWREVSDGE